MGRSVRGQGQGGRSGYRRNRCGPVGSEIRAGLPLSKLIGAHRDSIRCYNTSGGFLNAPLEAILDNATKSQEAGIGGIKIKVGHPDHKIDFERLTAMREHLGDDFGW